MNKKLYAIIISYNKIKPVINAVNSVFKSYPDSNIILIDNSENSKVFKILKSNLGKHSNISFKKNKMNLGFSKAVNQGVKIAMKEGADYIMLLNDDAYIDKSCIQALLEALERDEKALLAGPTIFYAKEPKRVWHTGGYFNKFLGSIHIPYKNKLIGFNVLKTLPVKEVDFLTGCVLMIKRKAFETVGFFDEKLFFYGEDLDYSLRVKKCGFKLLWVPYAFAWHDIDVDEGRISEFVMYNMAKSKMIVRRKNLSFYQYIWYILIHFSLLSGKKFWDLVIRKKKASSFIAWLRGSINGIK